MRRLRYQVAASLDGYIAGPGGDASWIPMDPDIDFAALFARYDTLLMGRHTYLGLGASGGTGMFGGMRIVVASRTLSPAEHPRVTVIGSDLGAQVAALKEEPGRDIWLFGGGALFASLLAAGLVDTVEPAVIPVLLGGGVPLLPPPAAQTPLTLTDHRVYPRTGTVLLEYAVTPPSRGRRGAPG
jgi:dihydrofolate reductase